MSSPSKNFLKRQLRVRSNIKKRNIDKRSKISIFRSNKNIYIQLIDIKGNVLHSCSSLVVDPKELIGAKGVDIARIVGNFFAKSCVDIGIQEVVFDKGPYLYSGRVKAVANSCREAGLIF